MAGIRLAVSPRTGLGRHVASISSWFYMPELGMDKFEILSRASTFCTPVQDPLYPRLVHFLCSSHVVCPWLYPNHYGDQWDWLQWVSEKHTRYSIEIRNADTGKVQTQLAMSPYVYPHPERDLAILHLDNEQHAMEQLAELGLELQPAMLSSTNVQRGQELEVGGHFLIDPPEDVLETVTVSDEEGPGATARTQQALNGRDEREQEDTRVLFPQMVRGAVLAAAEQQSFVRTETTLPMGMCGGPCFDHDGNAVGMVEGIVNGPKKGEDLPGTAETGKSEQVLKALQQLEGAAAIVNSSVLREFVLDVEEAPPREDSQDEEDKI